MGGLNGLKKSGVNNREQSSRSLLREEFYQSRPERSTSEEKKLRELAFLLAH